jgi:hypothetical protein
MRQDRITEADEQSLLSFARSYLAEGFPNPGRIGCPPEPTLRRLAERPAAADPSISEHLACCSECFKEYQELLAATKWQETSSASLPTFLKLGRAPLFVAATIAVIAAGGISLALWRSHRREVTHPGIAQKETNRVEASGSNAIPYNPFVLDMSRASQARGPKGRGQRPAVLPLPRTPLAISVYLPVGCDRGTYKVSLKRGDKKIWWSDATAELQGQRMVAQFKIDPSSYPPGRYTLTVSKAGLDLNQDVNLGERAQGK